MLEIRDPQNPREKSYAIVFYAIKKIKCGKEITYNYGDADKGVLEENPWLSK